MSSLLVFNIVYTLEIQSVMLVFSTGYVNYCPSITFSPPCSPFPVRISTYTVLFNRVYRLEIQSFMWVFSTSFVSYCPSITSLVSAPPPPPCPPFPVAMNILYTRTRILCRRGGGVCGHMRNTCRKIPLQVNFLDNDN
jgi:hypothetical protein